MFLQDLFSPEYVKVGLEAEDKDEVFEELADHLCQGDHSNLRDEVLEAVMEREAKMSTGIQKGIAIPHGKSSAIGSIRGVLGISKKGVEYDALDGEPVYLLFMIIAPPTDSEKHLHILKRVAELLENPQFCIELQAQGDAQGAFRVIKKYEDKLIALE
jgi:PTS system fructose-specific IIC component/PTS system nitrogen regulatory IIA component